MSGTWQMRGISGAALSADEPLDSQQGPRSPINTFGRPTLYRRVDPVEQALENLYRSSYARFEVVLTTVCRDREAARDVVQEAFAVALTKRRQYRGEGSLEAWVWKIALRLASGLRPNSSEPLPDRLDPALPEPESDPELAAAIRLLAPRRRLVIFLRHFADLSYNEIAEACGVSRGTVAATLAQAHAELGATLASENRAGGVR